MCYITNKNSITGIDAALTFTLSHKSITSFCLLLTLAFSFGYDCFTLKSEFIKLRQDIIEYKNKIKIPPWFWMAWSKNNELLVYKRAANGNVFPCRFGEDKRWDRHYHQRPSQNSVPINDMGYRKLMILQYRLCRDRSIGASIVSNKKYLPMYIVSFPVKIIIICWCMKEFNSIWYHRQKQ